VAQELGGVKGVELPKKQSVTMVLSVMSVFVLKTSKVRGTLGKVSPHGTKKKRGENPPVSEGNLLRGGPFLGVRLCPRGANDGRYGGGDFFSIFFHHFF